MTATVIGDTQLTKRRLQLKKYSSQKVEKITSLIEGVVISGEHNFQHKGDDSEKISQLKKKFSIASRSEKIQILTILPQSWPIRKVQEELTHLTSWPENPKSW